jgi:hypothetical protein
MVSDPVMVVKVFTCNPLSGEILALTLPEEICERFNPVIPEAGILNKFAPEPEKDPVNEVALIEPVAIKFPESS